MVGLPYELLETYLSHLRIVFRMWWNWKNPNPYQFVVDYMNKYYPPDWTYANFGPQFRADLYGEYRWEISLKILMASMHFRSEWMGRSIRCLRCKVSQCFSFFIEISRLLFRYVVLTSKVSSILQYQLNSFSCISKIASWRLRYVAIDIFVQLELDGCWSQTRFTRFERLFQLYFFLLNVTFLGDLAVAIRNRTNLVFGLYYSLFEWFNPVYLEDKSNNWTTQNYPKVNVHYAWNRIRRRIYLYRQRRCRS
jgi:hypothetical protein